MKKHNQNKKDMISDSGHYIKLRAFDKKGTVRYKPVSAVTFYRGTPPLENLRVQVKAIVTVNPWLAGQYRRHPKTEEFPSLWVPKKPDTTQYFETTSDPSVHPGMTYSEMIRCFMPFVVNKGKAGHTKAPNPLFKVVVIEGKDDCFCVVVSLCHTLGDAHTFYTICNMLPTMAPIATMEAKRINAQNKQAEITGKERLRWFNLSTTFIPIVLRMRFNKNKPIYRYINMDWVAEQKAKHQPTPEVPWVSTNDILASLIMNELKMDCGVMAVNARGRLPMLGKELAGTYFTSFFYMREEFKTPADIRLPLTGQRHPTWTIVPGRISSLFKNIGFVVTWASWDTKMPLEGGEQLFHIPLFTKPLPKTVAYIWRPKNGKLAVLLNANASTLETFSSHPALGEPLVE